MTVKRLRPLPSPDELAVMYAVPHDHRQFSGGHERRVEATIALARKWVDADQIADLSCGNGEIATRLAMPFCLATRWLGDFAPGYETVGPIEQTIETVPDEWAKTWILSETLEHLDDPALVLRRIRAKTTQHLVLSTPLGCWEDTNSEHLFAWDREGVEELLASAGWAPCDFLVVDGDAYLYGIWIAS